MTADLCPRAWASKASAVMATLYHALVTETVFTSLMTASLTDFRVSRVRG
jgi:hypothetical protein